MTYHWSGCDLVLSWCVHHCRSSCVGKYLLCTVYQSSKTVKRQPKQQKWPLVYQSSQVYQDCTNSVTTVYQSSIQSKTVKQQKMTIGVPIVTCLHRVRRIHKVRVGVRVRVRVHCPRPRPPNTQSRINLYVRLHYYNTVQNTVVYQFLPRDAMHSADCAVRLSVTRRYCVKTTEHILILFPSGSCAILVFPHQT